MIFPKHLQIETVAGFCPSRCIMCTIDYSPRKQIMSDEVFKIILERFYSYRDRLEYTTLHGLGEPLLDKNIANKVEMAKNLGFPSVGFATVAVNLSDNLAIALIDAGLDTIIFSVDGMKKDTHEAIRKGTDFEKVLLNIENFIRLRNARGRTKIIVRMIRQDLNRTEWDDYREFWSNRLNSDFGDQVSVFDVHNWGRGIMGRRLQIAFWNCRLVRQSSALIFMSDFLFTSMAKSVFVAAMKWAGFSLETSLRKIPCKFIIAGIS